MVWKRAERSAEATLDENIDALYSKIDLVFDD